MITTPLFQGGTIYQGGAFEESLYAYVEGEGTKTLSTFTAITDPRGYTGTESELYFAIKFGDNGINSCEFADGVKATASNGAAYFSPKDEFKGCTSASITIAGEQLQPVLTYKGLKITLARFQSIQEMNDNKWKRTD